MIIARYYRGMEVGGVSLADTNIPMPAGLWCAMGNYLYGGIGWKMTSPGLYRFWDTLTERCRSFLVWSYSDIDSFISGFSHMHMDGVTDNSLSITDLQVKMKWNRISTQCGQIANLMTVICSQYDQPHFASRIVNVATNQAPTIPGDSGHVLFEEDSAGFPRAWDVTNGIFFTDSAGKHLSVNEIISLGVINCAIVQFTPKLCSAGCTVNGFDWSYWKEFGESTRDWVNRIYQKRV